MISGKERRGEKGKEGERESERARRRNTWLEVPREEEEQCHSLACLQRDHRGMRNHSLLSADPAVWFGMVWSGLVWSGRVGSGLVCFVCSFPSMEDRRLRRGSHRHGSFMGHEKQCLCLSSYHHPAGRGGERREAERRGSALVFLLVAFFLPS